MGIIDTQIAAKFSISLGNASKEEYISEIYISISNKRQKGQFLKQPTKVAGYNVEYAVNKFATPI